MEFMTPASTETAYKHSKLSSMKCVSLNRLAATDLPSGPLQEEHMATLSRGTPMAKRPRSSRNAMTHAGTRLPRYSDHQLPRVVLLMMYTFLAPIAHTSITRNGYAPVSAARHRWLSRRPPILRDKTSPTSMPTRIVPCKS